MKKTSKIKDELEIEGYKIEGISIGGQETCIIFPSLSIAFDIGKCPTRAVYQQFLFISHGHLGHIGGLPMYVATCGLLSLKPPTIFVPTAIKEHVERLFDVHKAMDQSELKHTLVSLDVGEEFFIRKDIKVKAFKTYHVIPSQGYVVYSFKQKLKKEYFGQPGNEIKELKISGVEITDTISSPEIAFTGDTTAEFIVDPVNADVLRAKILVMECTFLDDKASVEHTRDYGHTHLAEIVKYADMFNNKAILLIHFSARYEAYEITEAVSRLPGALAGRVFTLPGCSTAKIRSEVLTPFRSVRMFFYLAFIASAGLGGLIALSQVIGALSNPARAAQVPEIVKGLGIDLGSVSIFAFLYSRENKAKNLQIARLSREENLSNLKVRVDEKKIIPVSSLRGIARLVILSGPGSYIAESFSRSKPFAKELLERGVLVVSFATDGQLPTFEFDESQDLEEMAAKRRRLWQLVPFDISEWSRWLNEQKELANVTSESPVYISLRLDGRVRGSGVGYPPWNAFVAQLPPAKGIWSGLLDGMDGRV